MKYCGNCGSELRAGNKFCDECGTPIAADGEAVTSSHNQQNIEVNGVGDVATTIRSFANSPEATLLANVWKLPAAFAAAAFVSALLTSAVLWVVDAIAGVEAPFRLVAQIVLYGSQKIPIVLSVGGELAEFGDDLGFTSAYKGSLLGGLLLVAFLLSRAGWEVARRETVRRRPVWVGVRVAAVFAALCFVGSFALELGSDGASIHPAHFRSLLYPFVVAVVFAGFGAWLAIHGRERVQESLLSTVDRVNVGARSPLLIGLRAVRHALVLSLAAVAVAAVVAAATNLGSLFERELIAAIAWAPIYVPHLVGAVFVFSFGIAAEFMFSGFSSALEEGTTSSVSLFGAGDPAAYLYLLMVIPIAATAWCGNRAAAARGGNIRARVAAAWVAGIPLVLALWVLAPLLAFEITGGISIGPVAGRAAFSAAGVVFLPLMWVLIGNGFGALVSAYRAGLLAEWAERVNARTGVARAATREGATVGEPTPRRATTTEVTESPPSPPATLNPELPATSAPTVPPRGADASSERTETGRWSCTACGNANDSDDAFCTSCGERRG